MWTFSTTSSRIEELMNEAALAAGATVVASVFQPFEPQGVTGVVVIEESHLSIHTWPEHGYAAVDFFTCGECTPEDAKDLLRRRARKLHVPKMMIVERGFGRARAAASSFVAIAAS